jgi:hypothetical protein
MRPGQWDHRHVAPPPDHTARGSVGFLTLGNLMGGTPLQPDEGVSHGTFSASLPGPSRRAAASRSGLPGRGGERGRRRHRPDAQRGSDQRDPVRIRRRQPVQVVVHISDDVIEASVLDHGPDLPARPQPMPTPTRWACAAGACGCCAGWWMRCGSARARRRSRATALQAPSGPNACLLYGYSSVNSMIGFRARASRSGQPGRG